jgi:hypothetical protein
MQRSVRSTRALSHTLLIALALSTGPAAAFCGLQSCPRPAGTGEVPLLEAGLRTRWVAYDIAGNDGSYVVTALRLFFNRSGLAVGAEVPFTRLDNGSSVATGLSNPVLMARYARRLSYAWSAEIGVQWELPMGDQEIGLAGDHNMLLPWVGARFDVNPTWYVSVMAGYSHALENAHTNTDTAPLAKVAHAGHDHEATPVLVNPHADREVQWRAAAGWMPGRGTLEGFGLGQTDVTATGPKTFVRAGASWEWTLARFTSLQMIGDVPVTTVRRSEVEIGLALKTGL